MNQFSNVPEVDTMCEYSYEEIIQMPPEERKNVLRKLRINSGFTCAEIGRICRMHASSIRSIEMRGNLPRNRNSRMSYLSALGVKMPGYSVQPTPLHSISDYGVMGILKLINECGLQELSFGDLKRLIEFMFSHRLNPNQQLIEGFLAAISESR